jgi:hypothetical protein
MIRDLDIAGVLVPGLLALPCLALLLRATL